MFDLCLSCLRGEFILFNHCMCDLEDCMLTYFWRPVRLGRRCVTLIDVCICEFLQTVDETIKQKVCQ